MQHSHDITLYIPHEQTVIPSPTPAHTYRPIWSLNLAIELWLDSKKKHTQSVRTHDAYKATLNVFRAALQFHGLDLDSVKDQDDKQAMQVIRDQVKQIAQVFAGHSERAGYQVKGSTINHRLAVLSSFYGFCVKQEWLDYNPVDHLERAKVEDYSDVKSLPFEEIVAIFSKMDMSKADHMRDAALLAIALQTGHRVSALAGLQWKHVTVVTVNHDEMVSLFFERCKGNKQTTVDLDRAASAALLRWVRHYYGKNLRKLPGESPIWVSLARGCDPITKEPSYGKQLSIQALGQICQKWTGTAHIHRLRNTFVMGMLESGASLREIQEKLLHSSMATTSRYVDKLNSSKNQYADKLSELFGIK